jgi:nitrile hydratase subunit alpha
VSHDHDHAEEPHVHRSPPRPDQDDTLTYYRALETAVRELLIEKNFFTAADVRREVESMDGRDSSGGAKMVARAWLDSGYKQRLLADGSAAAREAGLEVGPLKLIVVENTAAVHNVIVCTLCSCYPRMVLGLPPDWYKSRNYRSRAVREPREVLAEFGTVISPDVQIRVHDSTADMRYLVLPMRPLGTEDLGEADLARLVTRDSMIGVAVVEPGRG